MYSHSLFGCLQEVSTFAHFIKAFPWRPVAVVQFPPTFDDPLVQSVVEKSICVEAVAFWGSPESTFTNDIIRQREGLGKSHCSDDFICGRQDPESPLDWP